MLPDDMYTSSRRHFQGWSAMHHTGIELLFSHRNVCLGAWLGITARLQVLMLYWKVQYWARAFQPLKDRYGTTSAC